MTAAEMRKYSAKAKGRRFVRRALLVLLLLAVLLMLMERNFKPLVFSLAEARSAAMASQALYGALAEATQEGISYGELMNVHMDDRGQVALLSANTMKMNRLADQAGEAALRRLENMSSQRVTVPLGAALGMTIFAGSGPGIPVSIVPIGSIATEFATEFEASGINQTRHKVYLKLTASIRIVIPTGAKMTQVSANMLVAESIIVGSVPEGFVGYNLGEEELNMVP